MFGMRDRWLRYETLVIEEPNKGHGGHGSSSQNDTPGKNWTLRGVHWRVKLGILPDKLAPISELRRAAADGRRRYAELRRRLLVDPHFAEDNQRPSQLIVDNPLSLEPESAWGRYFRNAELERTIDKDLTRLYPENGIFFQSPACQAMLRRVLLVWSLIHPDPSYRQGMHELLAPLVYVLHVDVSHLEEVKHQYEDLFDRFDSLSTNEKKGISANVFIPGAGSRDTCTSPSDNLWSGRGYYAGATQEPFGVDADADMREILLGSDGYGAEGELGAVLSSRFLEHDAYCMFDALLRGQKGAVVMADYFLSLPGSSFLGGVAPVLETSATIYRALAAIDKPLYTHLVELGVEPQFFALRWLRLLFGREFLLEDILLVWDAIFSASNDPPPPERPELEYTKVAVSSPRSVLISSFAVSMILYLRPALLAAPEATGCLQRLLSFPHIPDVRSLIETAKLLQPVALAAVKTSFIKTSRSFNKKRTLHSRSGSMSSPIGQSLMVVPGTSGLLRMSLPDGYWEEKWTHSISQNMVPGDILGSQDLSSVGKLQTGQTSEATQSASNVANKAQETSPTPEFAGSNQIGQQAGGQSDGASRSVNKFETAARLSTTSIDNEVEKLVPSKLPYVNSSVIFKENQLASEVVENSTSGCTSTDHASKGQLTGDSGPCQLDPTSTQAEQLLQQQRVSSFGGFEALPGGFSLVSEIATATNTTIRSRVSITNGETSSSRKGDPHSCVPKERVPLKEDVSLENSSINLSSSDAEVMETLLQETTYLGRIGKTKPAKPSSARASKFDWIWGKNSTTDKAGGVANRDKNEDTLTTDNERFSFRSNSGPIAQLQTGWGASCMDVPRGTSSSGEMNSSELPQNSISKDCTLQNTETLAVQANASEVTELQDERELRKEVIIEEVLGERAIISPHTNAKKSKEKAHCASLQAFGVGMLKHIQVLESAITQRNHIDQEEQLLAGGRGRVTALVALAELRKISTTLQQL